MAVCPDNSTECLLRAILEANSGYDWNPLNFAFTAAIGALALVIACVTVFQGVLSAGPGQIKSSAIAIGPFASRTRRRFDRRELKYRYTAYVPLLSLTAVHDHLRKRLHLKQRDAKRAPLSGSGTLATWLVLLQAASLDELGIFQVARCATDWLPADLLAPPTSASLRCLVVLAALADKTAKIEKRGRFLAVFGQSSQLTFRDHPALGVLAAYERFDPAAGLMGDLAEANPKFFNPHGSFARDMLARKVSLVDIDLAVGNFRLDAFIVVKPLGKAADIFVPLVQALAWQEDGAVDGYLKASSEYWTQYLVEPAHADMRASSKSPPAFLTALALIVCESPRDLGAFPSDLFQLHHVAALLLDCAPVLKEPWPTVSATIDACLTRAGSLHHLPKTHIPPTLHRDLRTFHETALSHLSTSTPLPTLSARALLDLVDLLTALSALTFPLPSAGAPTVFDLLHDLSQRWCVPSIAPALAVPRPERPAPADEEAEKGLRALLVLRAVVFAAVLAAGADTSVLLEEGVGDAIVRIL